MKEKKIQLKRYITIILTVSTAPISIPVIGFYQIVNALNSIGDMYD